MVADFSSYLLQAEKLDEKLRYIVEQVPDRVYHVMGSNAGAGSGEFHTYGHSRRREQERMRRIDEEAERAERDNQRGVRLCAELVSCVLGVQLQSACSLP